MGGGGSVTPPPTPSAGEQLASSIQAYTANAPNLYAEEAQFQPAYNQLQQQMEASNIQNYANQYFGLMPKAQAAASQAQASASQAQLRNMQFLAPQTAQALMGSSAQYGQLAGLGQAQMAAGLDPTLTGIARQLAATGPQQAQPLYNLAAQAGQQVSPINQQLAALGTQAQAGTNQTVGQLGALQQNVLANARSDIFNATKGNVMSALGNLDPLTQQLSNTAQQQLALGGNMSPQMAADVAQQERAAFQSRGMLQ